MLHIIKLDSLSHRSTYAGPDYEVLYSNLLRQGGYAGRIQHYETRVKGEYPTRMQKGDIVLFGGSRLDAYANDEFTLRLLEFAKALLNIDGVKLIGICYGHQLIGRALGARVARAANWELGARELLLTDEGRKVFVQWHGGDGVIQFHSDQVMELPQGCILLASTADCPIQAYWMPGKALCIQGHPEFNSEIAGVLLQELRAKSPEVYDEYLATICAPHRGAQVGVALAHFVQ